MPSTVDETELADTRAGKRNYCPFGCETHELDENGYCPHLVGFTNDGKKYEPIERDGLRTRVVSGDRGKAMQKVEKGDRLINPERTQIDKGVSHQAKAWISSRVYREMSAAAIERLTAPAH